MRPYRKYTQAFSTYSHLVQKTILSVFYWWISLDQVRPIIVFDRGSFLKHDILSFLIYGIKRIRYSNKNSYFLIFLHDSTTHYFHLLKRSCYVCNMAVIICRSFFHTSLVERLRSTAMKILYTDRAQTIRVPLLGWSRMFYLLTSSELLSLLLDRNLAVQHLKYAGMDEHIQ